jgi:hypothetical protein
MSSCCTDDTMPCASFSDNRVQCLDLARNTLAVARSNYVQHPGALYRATSSRAIGAVHPCFAVSQGPVADSRTLRGTFGEPRSVTSILFWLRPRYLQNCHHLLATFAVDESTPRFSSAFLTSPPNSRSTRSCGVLGSFSHLARSSPIFSNTPFFSG